MVVGAHMLVMYRHSLRQCSVDHDTRLRGLVFAELCHQRTNISANIGEHFLANFGESLQLQGQSTSSSPKSCSGVKVAGSGNLLQSKRARYGSSSRRLQCA